ncbi:MAG TPA: glycosyltransferase [Solirubrobacteraceae bacterium]|nr:glycosyltransferase [Solirubrobacteraceae bacterium]
MLIVSLGSTAGLRAADEELRSSLERAGASVALVQAAPPREARTLMLTDFLWARAARAAVCAWLERARAGAVIYSTTTAALFSPRPGVIRFDACAAANRPGHHGLWQRPLERKRLAAAPLLLPWSEQGLTETPTLMAVSARANTLALPVPVDPSGPPEPTRDIAAITYAANPAKKGLDRVLNAWQRVRAPGQELVVAGAELELVQEGVRIAGALPREQYRALLRRSRVFISAARREDYGIAQLEALADGCMLVSTPAPGPYAALPIARELDARLVSDDLGAALEVALGNPVPGYAARAHAAMAQFSRDTVDRRVVEELLPRLRQISA